MPVSEEPSRGQSAPGMVPFDRKHHDLADTRRRMDRSCEVAIKHLSSLPVTGRNFMLLQFAVKQVRRSLACDRLASEPEVSDGNEHPAEQTQDQLCPQTRR